MDKKITLAATGDILLHKRVYDKAYVKENDCYNFDYMFEEVEHLFNKDHLIITNQESIIADRELGLSDFPHFNSPVEIAYKLKEMNVDIVNIANNHILDFGEKGVIKSIKNLEKVGLPYVGAYKSIEDQETIRVFHKNGLKICFLSYTISSGAGKRPKNKSYLSSEYKDFGAKWLRRKILKIKRELFIDVVIVSIHYGKEYHMLPTSEQIEIANDLADVGADIILGHHPHVLQPPAYLLDSRGKDVFVAYSLGNFFSGQFGLYRQIGAYITIDIEKTNNGELLKIDKPTMKLTFVDSGDKKDYKIRLLKDVVDSQNKIKTIHGEFDANFVYERMVTHMRKWIPNLDVT